MIRMRTAAQAYLEIKKSDPNTGVSERLIRDLINHNKIPVITQGTKKLINMDALEAYLSNPDSFSVTEGGGEK